MRQVIRPLVGALIVVWLATVADAATQTEIDNARNRGLAWLLKNQKGDGSWRSTPGTEFLATSDALQALNKVGLKNFSYGAGLAWLNASKPGSVDALARKIMALQQAGVNVAAEVDRLDQKWRNAASTFGAYDHFQTSFPDTPLAGGALRRARGYPFGAIGALDDINRILSFQFPSGAWPAVVFAGNGFALVSGEAVLPTAVSVLELQAIKAVVTTTAQDQAIQQGIAWLLTKQHTDGGIGIAATSTVLETALVVEVLAALRPTDSATTQAVDFLISQKRLEADGTWSWNGNALETALVVKVLPASPGVLADTDRDGLPDVIEGILGTNPINPLDGRDMLARSNGNGGPVGAPFLAAFDPGALNVPLPATVGLTANGDVNGDGTVDAADLALLEQIAAGVIVATPSQLAHGDVSPAAAPDGVINAADVDRLRRRVLGVEVF